jgi:hypothetical protein
MTSLARSGSGGGAAAAAAPALQQNTSKMRALIIIRNSWPLYDEYIDESYSHLAS